MIEDEQSLLSERGKKLKHEERIAGGLRVHQLRQRRGVLKLAAKRVGNQPPDVFMVEGPEPDLADPRPGASDGCQLPHQRMGGVDLVVAIGADQQQMSNVRLGQQILDAGRASPRPAIEDRRGRAPADVPAGEHADEATEHELKPPLRLLRRKLRRRAAARR